MTSLNEMVVVLKGFILHKGKVLMVQRAHDDEVDGGTWELVGGQIHFGEDLEAALLREIQEEVGWHIVSLVFGIRLRSLWMCFVSLRSVLTASKGLKLH
jgi:8-oxo-dGTP pyrophosphatase MutT (NUDIX family)